MTLQAAGLRGIATGDIEGLDDLLPPRRGGSAPPQNPQPFAER